MELNVHGRMAYAYTGGKPFNPALPCVVFVHGALHDHSCWNLLARWCAHHGHAVLAVDLPAHGRSEGPPLADVEALADWLLALLDAAGVQRAVLVGHSMGSLVALEAAGRAPYRAQAGADPSGLAPLRVQGRVEPSGLAPLRVQGRVEPSGLAPLRVQGLVMMGTAYPMQVSEALLTTALAEPLRAIDLVTAWSHASLAPKPSYPGPGMWLHGSTRALMQRMQAGCTTLNLFHHEFSICDRYRGGEAAAERLLAGAACPVHFVLGQADMMTMPKGARDLAARLQARVHLVPAGHNLMTEAPDATLAALRSALAASAAMAAAG